MMQPSNFDPWNMSEEAKKKTEALKKTWGVGLTPEQIKKMENIGLPQKLDKILEENKINDRQRRYDTSTWNNAIAPEKGRYLGDVRGVEKSDVGQMVSIDDYVTDLKEFKIVKDVYVLSDEREEDGTVSILLKLIPLMSVPPGAFDTENERITKYLESTSIHDAREVHVSFQYTEIFR